MEVVKNIVLAGMSLTVQDSETAKIQDLAHNFFLSTDDVNKNVSVLFTFLDSERIERLHY